MDVYEDLTPAPVNADVPLDASPLDAARAPASRDLRPEVRRLRWRTEVSTSGFAGSPPASLAFHGRLAGARPARAVHGHAHAHAHGRGRPLRPARRRLRALLGGSVLDDPALREDAVRQRRACWRRIRKPRWRRASRCSDAWRTRPPSGCCARCRTTRPKEPGAASTPPTTPTPRATKASSTCGRARKYEPQRTPLEWNVVQPRASASTRTRTSKAPGICHVLRVGRSTGRSLQTRTRPRREGTRFRAREAARRSANQRIWPAPATTRS